MKNKYWVFLAIIIVTTAGLIILKNILFSSQTKKEFTNTSSSITSTILVPSPTYDGCAFMWAYHDDSGLSSKIDEAVRDLNLSASANVQLFGEDCVYADEQSTFGAMETDFYVRLPVDDLSADEEFGVWIRQVMEVIITMPEDNIPGSKGFVEFQLTKSESEQIIFRVSIDEYQNLAPNITDAELFRTFYTPPTPSSPAGTTPPP